MEYAALVSGGVDSAVALHDVAARADGRVTAYYLKIWLEDELAFLGACPWEEDLSYARAVCQSAGVPLEVVPLQREYYDRVVSYALDELRGGGTPSPDIFCNRRIKFDAFLDAIDGRADRIVTGHYARVDSEADRVRLAMAPDPVKDQTYFLSHLTEAQLRRADFPLGRHTKAEVRARAAELALANRDRPDSQGICFLGRIRYPDFVRHYLGEREGAIVDADSGAELGRHRGAWFFTIGQRQGLGLGNGPWYVVGRDVDRNVVTVAHADRAERHARRRLTVGEVSWIGAPAGEAEVRACKLRHGPDLVPCTLERIDDERFTVTLERPDRGVAPGQFAVFYDPPWCLGGARILPDRPEAA